MKGERERVNYNGDLQHADVKHLWRILHHGDHTQKSHCRSVAQGRVGSFLVGDLLLWVHAITFLNPFTKLSLCFWGSCRLFLMILCCCWWTLAWVSSSSCLLAEKDGGHWLTSKQALIKCCLVMWLMTSIECVCKDGHERCWGSWFVELPSEFTVVLLQKPSCFL